MRTPKTDKASKKILTKSDLGEFASMEKGTWLLSIERMRQSKKFVKPSYHLKKCAIHLKPFIFNTDISIVSSDILNYLSS